MPGGAGRAANAPVYLGASQSGTRPEARNAKNPSWLGTVSANNYPQIPRLASTCRPGHMRSFLFGRNFPLYAQHMESIVFGAHRKGLPGIADHHRTGHWQIATAAPDRAAPPTGLRPGNDAAPARRAHSSTRSKNHTRRIPTGVSRSSGSSAETHSSTAAPAASSAGRPSGPDGAPRNF